MWQHWDDCTDEISAVPALLSLAVERRARFYVGTHIGDVDSDTSFAIFKKLEREGVIKVFCIIGIDGEGKKIAAVLAISNIFRAHNIGYVLGLLLYR